MCSFRHLFTIFLSLTFGACFMMFIFTLEDFLRKPVTIRRDSNNEYTPTDQKLFNLNFKYVINNRDVCNKDFLAVFIVTSYIGDVELRSAMRRAVSERELDALNIRRVFLLATEIDTNKFGVSQDAIEDESNKFGDIVQGNFIENYKNLTYKHMMGLNWATKYCPDVKFIVKMDDDIVIDIFKIVKLLQTDLSKQDPKKLLAGYVFRNMSPIREPSNKWFVSNSEYDKSTYPPFLSGWFYVSTPVAIKQLLNVSPGVPYFWIDDLYVTGLLVDKLKWKYYDLSQLFTVSSLYVNCCVDDNAKFNYDCEFVIGPNGGDNNMFVKFHKLASKCFNNECKQRPADKQLKQTCFGQRRNNPTNEGDAVIERFKLFKK